MRLAYLLRENTRFIISILSATIRRSIQCTSIHPVGNAVQAVGAIHNVNAAVRTVDAVHSLSI